jgi:hypothetical protein
MSHDQIQLARTLAHADPTTCFLYLSRIVPGESTERRHELAKHLAEIQPTGSETSDGGHDDPS